MKKQAIAKSVLAVSALAGLYMAGTTETVQAGMWGNARSTYGQQVRNQNSWQGHHGMHHGQGNAWGRQMMGGAGWDMDEMHDYWHGANGGHMHDQSGYLPADLQPAADPTYAVGEEVVLLHGHMPGMEGAEAKVVGAFDTIAYEVTYYPVHGGEPVYNHRWVIQEEIQDAGEEALEVGSEVILEAHHMPGMYGATAVIEAVEETTVYMVDYQPTDGGAVVRNHKWVTEAELAPAE